MLSSFFIFDGKVDFDRVFDDSLLCEFMVTMNLSLVELNFLSFFFLI